MPGIIWFLLKLCFVFFMFAMVKAIVPRYRYDQLMRLGWKVFLPLSLFWVALTAGVLVDLRMGCHEDEAHGRLFRQLDRRSRLPGAGRGRVSRCSSASSIRRCGGGTRRAKVTGSAGPRSVALSLRSSSCQSS